ncbi:MAG: hypothetical protein ACE37B_06910 [Ilumatobacter sp.]|uniref:hypothetical protein n=1 Tax=Ilumatobacter sp. TaxID=1967498 RepID=UPI00391C1899
MTSLLWTTWSTSSPSEIPRLITLASELVELIVIGTCDLSDQSRVHKPIGGLAVRRLGVHSGQVKQRNVRPLGLEELNALTTKRLLAYRSRLLSLQESAAESDMDESQVAELDPALLHFKDQALWLDTYAQLKTILARREHVD